MTNKINIATGLSIKSTSWKNKSVLWSDFVEKIRKENRTGETYQEFIRATKDEQLKIKDVGGYVGGYLRAGRRKPENIVSRSIVTLDIDFATLDFWDTYTLLFDNAAILHSTHKHCKENPRYRLILPLNREVTREEYTPIARKIAGDLNIELFDNTTFQPYRLMFWPSNPKDTEYVFEHQEGPWIDPDEILESYIDWKDASLWPVSEAHSAEVKSLTEKQEDPTEKRGIIGAFCRAYPIEEAIETFLTEEYVKTNLPNRYTYTKGSTSAGLIVYENLFAYSHHGTDPISGKLCNAFDLVRIHKYGNTDKSVKEIEEFIRKDPKVKNLIAEENINTARFDFAEDATEINVEWAKEMEIDGRGNYKSIAPNINLILANDDRLKNAFKYNEFDSKNYAVKNLPWRLINSPEPLKNVDYSGVRNYIESVYGITGNLKIDDSLILELERNKFNPVKDYLKSLTWDGTLRVDNLLIDYFGAEDNTYTREAIRKMLTGAVARIFQPGIKFDLVLTLVSEEGTGKSTFVNKLGKSWFSDTFITVHGKEAFEQIQGVWIVEMAELSGLKRAEVEAVKHFITKQEDTFRPAYHRVSETYKRQCVFFGTTNDRTFLRDQIGNRRFMPITVRAKYAKKSVFTDLDEEIDQIWAEAVQVYKSGEKLFLSAEANRTANEQRIKHIEVDERKGVIEEYLNRKLPATWDTLDLDQRRMFLYSNQNGFAGFKRSVVCIPEIWAECLGKDKADMSRYNTRDLNEIMRSLPEWVPAESTKVFPLYGIQRYYKRIEEIWE